MTEVQLSREENDDVMLSQIDVATETLPAEYLNRRSNRGFEAVAYDTDTDIVYAFIQTPLSNPDRATGDASSVIRMLGIDPSSGNPVAEYVYLLQKPELGNNVDKVGDAVYAGDGKFMVVERDSSMLSRQRNPVNSGLATRWWMLIGLPVPVFCGEASRSMLRPRLNHDASKRSPTSLIATLFPLSSYRMDWQHNLNRNEFLGCYDKESIASSSAPLMLKRVSSLVTAKTS